MNKLLLYVLALIALCFSSCSEYGEEVWINADGSGRYEMNQDLSSMLPFIEMGLEGAKQKLENAENEDSIEGEKKKMDPSKFIAIFESGKADTTFNFESIAKEGFEKDGEIYSRTALKAKMQEKMSEGEDKFKGTKAEKDKIWSFVENVLDMKTRIQYDQESSMLKNTISQKFKSTDDMMFSNLPELIDIISKYDTDNDRLNDPATKEAMTKIKESTPTYELSKGMIKVRRKAMDMESARADEETQQGMQMMQGMMGNSTYTLTIHVPGKVKKVSKDGASFKGSTVTWTMPALDMYDTTKDLNLDIAYKPKKKIKY